jgi:hypothetical protein
VVRRDVVERCIASETGQIRNSLPAIKIVCSVDVVHVDKDPMYSKKYNLLSKINRVGISDTGGLCE